MKEKIIIQSTVCYYCKEDGKEQKVEIRAGLGQSWGSERSVDNQVFSYFSCPHHGGVPALINGKLFGNPFEMFKEIRIWRG